MRAVVEHLARPPRHPLPTMPIEPPAYDPEELLGIIPEDTKFPFEVTAPPPPGLHASLLK